MTPIQEARLSYVMQELDRKDARQKLDNLFCDALRRSYTQDQQDHVDATWKQRNRIQDQQFKHLGAE